jgi:hypothetical protein
MCLTKEREREREREQNKTKQKVECGLEVLLFGSSLLPGMCKTLSLIPKHYKNEIETVQRQNSKKKRNRWRRPTDGLQQLENNSMVCLTDKLMYHV